MYFPAIGQVEGYWQGLFENAVIPARSAVDPRGMESALEYAFLLERIAPGVARIRLSGMHLNDILGMDVRGMPLTALFAPAARKDIANAIERVCNGPRLADLEIRSRASAGRAQLDGRLFMAPLTSEDGRVTRMLACLQTQGVIGRTPRRFDSAYCATRHLETAASAPCHPKIRQIAFAEDPAAFTASPSGAPATAPATAPAKHPHLRLVHSAD